MTLARSAGSAGNKAGVAHRTRPALASRFPVHVTMRVRPEVWNLRSRRAVFWGNHETLGVEPYVTDGTPGGTHLIKDVNPGAGTVMRCNYPN